MRPLSSSALHTKLIHKYAVLIIIVQTVDRDRQLGVCDQPSRGEEHLGYSKTCFFLIKPN